MQIVQNLGNVIQFVVNAAEKLQHELAAAASAVAAVVADGQFCLFSWLVCQKVWPCRCCHGYHGMLFAVRLLPRIAASLLTISRIRCRADVQHATATTTAISRAGQDCFVLVPRGWLLLGLMQ